MTTGSTPEEILATTLSKPPTCGRLRVIAIDGPTGSGKTTLANDLVRAAPDTETSLLRLEDIYPGWNGLPLLPELLEPLLRDLEAGRGTHYRRFDWHRLAPAEIVHLEPASLLIIEGVGAGCRAWHDLITTLVFVVHDHALDRAVDRDGPENRALLEAWHQDEERLFAEERPQDHADFMIRGGAGTARCR